MNKKNNNEPKIYCERYEEISKCGEGSYGRVYRCKDLKSKDKKEVAIKIIKMGSVREGAPASAIREVSIQSDLKHINIVKLSHVVHYDNTIYVEYEFINKDLRKLLKEGKGMPFQPKLIKSYMYQLLKGVEFLHKSNILHRDIKLANLLVTKEHILKITDFGLAINKKLIPSKLCTWVSTLWYKSPDVILGNAYYDTSLDMWSIGCVFGELAFGDVIFKGSNDKDQVIKIFSILGSPNLDEIPLYKKLPGYLENSPWDSYKRIRLENLCPILDYNGIDLLKQLLCLDPEKRISASDALNHPYFEDIDQKTLSIYQ